jgi:hypothetical protein
MQDRWNGLEADAAAAREAAEEAHNAAAKADADLAALSTAYNDLEEHAFKLEEQLKQLEQAGDSQQQHQAGAAVGGVPEAEVQERITAALEQVGLSCGGWLAVFGASSCMRLVFVVTAERELPMQSNNRSLQAGKQLSGQCKHSMVCGAKLQHTDSISSRIGPHPQLTPWSQPGGFEWHQSGPSHDHATLDTALPLLSRPQARRMCCGAL